VNAEQAQRVIDGYVAAWNEAVADERGRMLGEVMSEESRYLDPNVELDSRSALDGYIGEVLSRYPGRRIVRTSEVDVHHTVGRFHWRLIKADGTRGQESVDFVEFARDGRIARVIGFFGPISDRSR